MIIVSESITTLTGISIYGSAADSITKKQQQATTDGGRNKKR
jgi:hypothetical protein